jgi:hypothetical protein
MTTQLPVSQTHSLSEGNPQDEQLSIGMLAYFRGRLSNRIHELVLSEFLNQERVGKITRAQLARRVRRKPEQLSRWLGTPGNWTLDTLSDLLLGMGLEPAIHARNVSNQKPDTSHTAYHVWWTKVFMNSHVDVQTPLEVARDLANGNAKSMYFSVKLPADAQTNRTAIINHSQSQTSHLSQKNIGFKIEEKNYVNG